MNIITCDGVTYDDQLRALPARLMHHKATILFIGTHCNFSQSLVSVTNRELGDIGVAAVHSFRDLRQMLDFDNERPALLVLDEPTLRNLDPDDRDNLLTGTEYALAIAFCSIAFGKVCYEDEKLRQRAASIFPLNLRLDVWLSVIRLIAHGGNYICPEIIQSGETIAPPAPEIKDCGLTCRQHDVMRLVADGRSNKQIAAALDLSIHTVKLHLRNASLRLGAHNRTEAAMRYRARQA